MRFPRFPGLLLATTLATVPGLSLAAAEQVRAEITARLQRELPTLSATDYAWGSAAFDAELRAQVEAGAGEAAPVLESGKKAWQRKFKNGRGLSGCFPNGGRRIAGTYPQYDPRLKRVVTLEMAVNQCLKTHNEAPLDPDDPATMGAIIAYLRSLSDKQKIAVRVSAAAESRFEEGRRLYFTRMGQRNFACASCHIQAAGKRFHDMPLSPAVGQAAHAPAIREGRAVTLQTRMRECLERMGAAPFPAASEELNHLEYFLTYLSNGLALRPNAWRPKPAP